MEQETPSHEIIVTSTPEERQECIDLRIKVFHLEQKFPLETEIDEHVPIIHIPTQAQANHARFHRNEEISTHFLLRLTPSRTPVGTIRLFQVPGTSYYKLTRLAVLKDYRRHRFGKGLVQALHEWLKQYALQIGHPGPVMIVCHSQMPVQGFYTKFGYAPEGQVFDEDGDPHQKMVLRMPL